MERVLPWSPGALEPWALTSQGYLESEMRTWPVT